MLIVGLTGGIGSGKSTVSEYFAQLGAPIIDSDVIARQCVAQDQLALAQLQAHFGDTILTKHGDLDRAVLRQRIFNNSAEREWLENCLHPLIRDEMHHQIQQCSAPYVIVAIPLLLESGKPFAVDRIVVVDVPEDLQQQRAQQRDQHSANTITAIMNAQVSRQHRLAAADDVIDNSGSLDDLKAQVQALHQGYLGACKNPPN